MSSRLSCALIFLALAAFVPSSIAQQPAAAVAAFSGKFADLQPEQKRLAEDWFHRLSEVMNKKFDPAEAYDNLPLSTRTTFTAITHALMQTPLTDAQGVSLGKSALDIIDKIDEVHGMLPGAGGDEQYRIYVQLNPKAIELLEKAQAFKHVADNTVFHKGYPICYRGRSGVPSIQVSMTRDASRADIDVDYRSSKFPAALINGHLASSNSDVRAGDNDNRHNSQWSGLNNWWQNLLGFVSIKSEDATETRTEKIPSVPKTPKNAAPEVAIHDFLATWLVDQKPEEIIPYFAATATDCMELQSDKKVDHGMLRFAILKSLQDANKQIGKVSDVAAVTEGVQMPGKRVKLLPNQYQSQFVLYDVREDLAEQLKCGSQVDPTPESIKALNSTSYGKYMGAVFRMKKGPRAGEAIATIWEKVGGYWRLVSYINKPEVDIAEILKLPLPAVLVPVLPEVDGDPALIKAATDFHTQWFIRSDITKTMSYLSPKSLRCINGMRDESVPAATTPAQQQELIRSGMEKVTLRVGKVSKLSAAIKAPIVSHPDLKIVKQKPENAEAFAFASLPDSLFAEQDCEQPDAARTRTVSASPASLVYGNYYATGFRLANSPADSDVLLFVWAKENDAWKIVFFMLLAP